MNGPVRGLTYTLPICLLLWAPLLWCPATTHVVWAVVDLLTWRWTP